jgi:hypothetical protein
MRRTGHPRPDPAEIALGGDLAYAPAMAEQVLTAWAGWVAGAPATLVSAVVCHAAVPAASTGRHASPTPAAPDPLDAVGSARVVVRACWWGPPDDGREVLGRWRAAVPPLIDRWGTLSAKAVARLGTEPAVGDATAPTTGRLDRIDEHVARAVTALTFPSGGAAVVDVSELRHLGGPHPFAFRALGGPADTRRSAVLRVFGPALTASSAESPPGDELFRFDDPRA